MIDTTVGVGINYVLLRFSEKYLRYDSGKYYDLVSENVTSPLNNGSEGTYDREAKVEIDRSLSNADVNDVARLGSNKYMSAWMYQILIWICICSVMKIIVA